MARVYIKMLSGDLLSLEVDAQITVSGFYRMVFDEIETIREMWQLMLMRFRDGEFVEMERSDALLMPEEEETFSAFVESVRFTVKIDLAASEVFDSLHENERYDLYDIRVTRYMDSEMKATIQGIYVRPMYAPDGDVHYYLEGDRNIPAQRMGRFGDEWDIEVHEGAQRFDSLEAVVLHMKFDEELSDRAKRQVGIQIREEWMATMSAMFNRFQEDDEYDQQYEEYNQQEEDADSWS